MKDGRNARGENSAGILSIPGRQCACGAAGCCAVGVLPCGFLYFVKFIKLCIYFK